MDMAFKTSISLVACFITLTTIREALSCQGKDIQMIAAALEEVLNWDVLAAWLEINSATIKTNCAPSHDLAQCYRRKLVKTHCDRLPSGDPYLAVEGMADVLEIKMKKRRQARALRDLNFSSYPNDHSSISRYAAILRDMYAKTPVIKSDKLLHSPSKVYVKLALVKKERVSHSMVDEFTRLTLQGDVDQILHDKEKIEMDNIFMDGRTRLVLVEGAPGIGKSTLAWELCRQWPTLESLQHFSLVVFIRLREEGVRSATDLSDLLYHRDMVLRRHVKDEVEKKDGDGVLFIFDGFDEFPFELREKSLVMDIISGSEYLPKATVLVTSRPSASAQLQSHLQSSIGKHIEVVGFTEKEILEYASGVFTNTDLLSNFKTYLAVNPVVKGMMYNPMNCAIVVGVYMETSELGKPVPHTQTQLYTELTLCLLSRHLSAEGDSQARRLPDKLEDLPHVLYMQLMKIAELALEGKLQKKIIFDQLPEGSSNLGLLVEHRALYARKEMTTFNFFHLTLQEYMSAFYISQLPASEQRELFTEHSQDLAVVWRFVAGLTKMQHIGWDVLKKHNMNPILFQCFYEAQDVQNCSSVFGQNTVEFKTKHRSLSNYDFYALGYCICACSNSWSLQVVVTDVGLEMLTLGMKSVKYGGGSIDDLWLSRSNAIMNKLDPFLRIPKQVLQTVEYLFLVYCGMEKEGLDNLATLIPRLSSLISLDVSDNPGGAGSLVKLLEALRQHGKLQKLHMEEIKIGVEDVAALSHIVHPQSSFRELRVGVTRWTLPPEVNKQLVRTVLSPSSLEIVYIFDTGEHEPYVLDYVVSVSDSIASLAFYQSHTHKHTNLSSKIPSKTKGGTKLSHILRKNTSLRQLALIVPLDKDEVDELVQTLEVNHSLEELVFYEMYHAEYFPDAERPALDPRIYVTFHWNRMAYRYVWTHTSLSTSDSLNPQQKVQDEL